ncbi:hypothetical protein D3C71_1567140 [compost metagenome]
MRRAQLLCACSGLLQAALDFAGSGGAALDAILNLRQSVTKRGDARLQLIRTFCQLLRARYGLIQLRLVCLKLRACLGQSALDFVKTLGALADPFGQGSDL